VFKKSSDPSKQVVKVIELKGRIATAHGRFSGIRRVAPLRTLI